MVDYKKLKTIRHFILISLKSLKLLDKGSFQVYKHRGDLKFEVKSFPHRSAIDRDLRLDFIDLHYLYSRVGIINCI